MVHWPADRLKTQRAGRANRLPPIGPQRFRLPGLVAASLVTSGCGLLYALYRAYYGFGGTVGMIGRPASQAEWRLINLIAAAVLLVAALLLSPRFRCGGVRVCGASCWWCAGCWRSDVSRTR
jgi:hypothetical protein